MQRHQLFFTVSVYVYICVQVPSKRERDYPKTPPPTPGQYRHAPRSEPACSGNKSARHHQQYTRSQAGGDGPGFARGSTTRPLASHGVMRGQSAVCVAAAQPCSRGPRLKPGCCRRCGGRQGARPGPPVCACVPASSHTRDCDEVQRSRVLVQLRRQRRLHHGPAAPPA